ncbi:hypothetical protein Dimus_029307, partial [Dionaea muscipula]
MLPSLVPGHVLSCARSDCLVVVNNYWGGLRKIMVSTILFFRRVETKSGRGISVYGISSSFVVPEAEFFLLSDSASTPFPDVDLFIFLFCGGLEVVVPVQFADSEGVDYTGVGRCCTGNFVVEESLDSYDWAGCSASTSDCCCRPTEDLHNSRLIPHDWVTQCTASVLRSGSALQTGLPLDLSRTAEGYWWLYLRRWMLMPLLV